MLTPAAIISAMKSRPQIMGILNITPDSFSDGGAFTAPDKALAQAKTLVAEGATILDLGAESSRPGHTKITPEEEWARLAPVLARITAEADSFAHVALSIDTTKASIARKALAMGAAIINDIWGLQGDPAMAQTVAESAAVIIIMHNRQTIVPELDIMDDLFLFFERSLTIAQRAGIAQARIILDPGIGFGKTQAQNLACLRHLERLCAFGCPVLLGVSRKSLFQHVLGLPVEARLAPTLWANMMGLMKGAAIIRVHDVAEHRDLITFHESVARA